jgi:hypothetical protein
MLCCAVTWCVVVCRAMLHWRRRACSLGCCWQDWQREIGGMEAEK